jgi:hypothetical protein
LGDLEASGPEIVGGLVCFQVPDVDLAGGGSCPASQTARWPSIPPRSSQAGRRLGHLLDGDRFLV